MKKILFIFLWISHICFAQSPTDIQILFVGDMMLDELPGSYIKNKKNPISDFETIFKSSDITIGNLESVVGTGGVKTNKPYTFLAHPRVIPFLKKNFSAVSIANNHTGDYGDHTFLSMMGLFEKAQLKYFGGGKDLRSAHEPFIVDVKGKRIAILGFDIFLPRSFEALPDRAGVAWGEDDYITADIQRARNFYKADFVVTFPHWGWENEKNSSPEQQRLARLMIDSGADLVVGGHPHVTQNIEIYKNKAIFYSLGNFIFNGFKDKEATTGWALEFHIKKDSSVDWKIHEAILNRYGIPKNNGVVKTGSLASNP
ncbi:MAG: CapA family protein [Betaproteobacteria bacterium]|nr:CapA family protein [Betaproteobacteria bacterium]